MNVEIGSEFTYEVYDIEGSLVEKVDNSLSETINLGHLPRGVYTFLVKTGDKRKSYKLVRK